MNEQIKEGEELTEDNAGEIASDFIKIADLDGNGTIDADEFK